jgi:hypothetical protein
MDRKQVAVLFKEMFDNCPYSEGKSFMLMPPNVDVDDVLSKDYQIHIKSELTEETVICIRRTVKKHDTLAMNEQKNLLVIYEPLKQS